MKYSPHRRITPLEALMHPFFDELRDQATFIKLKKEYQIPDLFDFAASKEVTPAEMDSLVPDWYS
jgi:glycogen synthase kinase 3 beta